MNQENYYSIKEAIRKERVPAGSRKVYFSKPHPELANPCLNKISFLFFFFWVLAKNKITMGNWFSERINSLNIDGEILTIKTC